MSADDGSWMLPSISNDMGAVNSALDMVKLSLTQRRAAGDAVPAADLSPAADPEALCLELAQVSVALSNLSAVLLLIIQAKTTAAGERLDGLWILEMIRTHERARSDLQSLDDGAPFGE